MWLGEEEQKKWRKVVSSPTSTFLEIIHSSFLSSRHSVLLKTPESLPLFKWEVVLSSYAFIREKISNPCMSFPVHLPLWSVIIFQLVTNFIERRTHVLSIIIFIVLCIKLKFIASLSLQNSHQYSVETFPQHITTPERKTSSNKCICPSNSFFPFYCKNIFSLI